MTLSFAQERRAISIIRIEEKVKIDGVLDEAFWNETEVASEFTAFAPVAGLPSMRKTETRIAYDDDAIYVSAILYDERDSMSTTLSQRDDAGTNADWFGITFDPYNAGTIGFSFLLTSAGVQIDMLELQNSDDINWNAVWQSATKIHDDKWIAEIRIPFSALRFPKEDVQTWGVNFVRSIRRKREESHWQFNDPTGMNYLSQLGQLDGIENVRTPFRLSLTPYVSGYIENYNNSTGYTLNGGMDLKYGINDAFTLDMTLVPDFGQVQFDNQVLNLSPFEVQYNERRQFFIEGTELFNKAGLFYSRRIGGTPINLYKAYSELDDNEEVIEIPTTTQLLNATKVSGRTKKGTGIGIFNAVTANEYAIARDTVSGEKREILVGPMANYNVFVLDQNLANNSTVTLTNTNVWRAGETYDANVTGLNYNLFTKEQRYNTYGSVSVSQKYYAPGNNSLGYAMGVGVGKSSGKLRYGLGYGESNDSYDRNDLGYQTTNNLRSGSVNVNYNIFSPIWRFNRLWYGLSMSYTRLVNPDAFSSSNINFNMGGAFRNYLFTGFNIGGSPTRNHNWFEPRTSGRYYEEDEYVYFSYFVSSDYSKKFAYDAGLDYTWLNDSARYSIGVRLSPRYRFGDRFLLILNSNFSFAQNEEGVAVGSIGIPYDGDDPVFSKRDRTTVTNTVNAEYIFNNKMGITFRLRHYWSKVEYHEFFRLTYNGEFAPTDYNGLSTDGDSYHNNSFNAFTIDMAYRWVFAPGSELSLVWKNSIFSSSDAVQLNYFENLGTMVENPATNSLSLKILYYINYWSVHQKIFKGQRREAKED